MLADLLNLGKKDEPKPEPKPEKRPEPVPKPAEPESAPKMNDEERKYLDDFVTQIQSKEMEKRHEEIARKEAELNDAVEKAKELAQERQRQSALQFTQIPGIRLPGMAQKRELEEALDEAMQKQRRTDMDGMIDMGFERRKTQIFSRMCARAHACAYGVNCHFAHSEEELENSQNRMAAMARAAASCFFGGDPDAAPAWDWSESGGDGESSGDSGAWLKGMLKGGGKDAWTGMDAWTGKGGDAWMGNGGDGDAMPSGYKTTLCKFFMAGTCAKGLSCPFAHGVHDLAHKPGQSSGKGGPGESEWDAMGDSWSYGNQQGNPEPAMTDAKRALAAAAALLKAFPSSADDEGNSGESSAASKAQAASDALLRAARSGEGSFKMPRRPFLPAAPFFAARAAQAGLETESDAAAFH